MRILAAVDMHGNRRQILDIAAKGKSADIVLCAGDVSTFGQHLDAIYADLASSERPILVVHGNHETAGETKKACSLFDNIHFIHRRHLVIDNTLFLGFGGGGFAEREPDFESMADHFRDLASKHERVVLLVHAPPHGTALDRLGSSHHGNKSFTDFLASCKVDLLICGHFHDNAGKEDKKHGARLVNPGPRGQIIEL